jgi:hypothetical protein
MAAKLAIKAIKNRSDAIEPRSSSGMAYTSPTGYSASTRQIASRTTPSDAMGAAAARTAISNEGQGVA